MEIWTLWVELPSGAVDFWAIFRTESLCEVVLEWMKSPGTPMECLKSTVEKTIGEPL